MEMQIVMSLLVPRYDFALVPGHRVIPRPGLTLGFQDGACLARSASFEAYRRERMMLMPARR